MKNGHEWWKYVYDEFYNCVICPEYQPLKYNTLTTEQKEKRKQLFSKMADAAKDYIEQRLHDENKLNE